jgi:ankyrin repeat protein
MSEVSHAGEAALRMAAATGDLEAVLRHLLVQGTNVNAVSSATGWTGLYHACASGNIAIAAFLLQNGADVNHVMVTSLMCDGSTTTALEAAVRCKHVGIVRLLLENGATVHHHTILHMACRMGLTEISMLLVEAGANVNAADCRGMTPLLISSFHGHFEVVSLLLDSGACTFALQNEDDDEEEAMKRNTALHFAVMGPSSNKARVASLLLTQTITNANAQFDSRRPFLHHCVSLGDHPMVEILLRHGADPATKDANGKLAIVLACEQGSIDCIFSLLRCMVGDGSIYSL